MVTSMRLLLWALLLSLPFLQSAEAGGLTRDDLKGVQAIAVDKNVTVTKTMSYLGPDQGIGLIFGIVGAAAESATSADQRPEQVIVDFAAQNNISIAEIVREATLGALRKSGLVQSVDGDAQGAASLKIDIKQYGLYRPTLFTKKLVSVLTVKYALVGEKDEALWDDSYRVTPLSSPVEPTSLEDIKANPAVLAELYRKAAESAAQRAFPPQENPQQSR